MHVLLLSAYRITKYTTFSRLIQTVIRYMKGLHNTYIITIMMSDTYSSEGTLSANGQ